MKRLDSVLLRDRVMQNGVPRWAQLREATVDASPYWPELDIEGQLYRRVDFAIDGTWIMEPVNPGEPKNMTSIMLTNENGDVSTYWVEPPLPDDVSVAGIRYQKIADRRAHDGLPEYRADV